MYGKNHYNKNKQKKFIRNNWKKKDYQDKI